jgi:hypothetical protein
MDEKEDAGMGRALLAGAVAVGLLVHLVGGSEFYLSWSA